MPGQATQPMKLAIGAESLIVPHLERDDMDEVQLITADGQHFALVQQSPVWENAELIVKAVKAQDVLAAVAKQASDLLWQWHEGLTPLDANGVHDAVQALDAAVDATEPTIDMNQQAEELVDEEGNVRLGIVDSEGTEYVIRAMTEEEKSAN